MANSDSASNKPPKLTGRTLAAKIEGARTAAAEMRKKAKDDMQMLRANAKSLEHEATKLAKTLRAQDKKQRKKDEGRVRKAIVEALADLVPGEDGACRLLMDMVVAALPSGEQAIAAEMLGLVGAAPTDVAVLLPNAA